MSSLVNSLRKSIKSVGLAGIVLSNVFLGGCANVDPDAAMFTTLAGVVLGGLPGASAADIAVGNAMATGGALGYQRSSYENAARQVGQGGNQQQNTNTYLVRVGDPMPIVKYDSEMVVFGDWKDIDGDGGVKKEELFHCGKNYFRINEEPIGVFLFNLPPGQTVLSLWNSTGQLLAEYKHTCSSDKNGFGLINHPPDSGEEIKLLWVLEGLDSGEYKLVALLPNGEMLGADIHTKRSDKPE